jgi:hypothetical protein
MGLCPSSEIFCSLASTAQTKTGIEYFSTQDFASFSIAIAISATVFFVWSYTISVTHANKDFGVGGEYSAKYQSRSALILS